MNFKYIRHKQVLRTGLTKIEKSPQEKRALFLALLNNLNCIYISKGKEMKDLADKYLQAGFLTEKHADDLEHLASAVISQCDYVVSWNMRHIVREKTISGIHAVNGDNNYHTPSIVTPTFFIEENNDENN